MKVSIVGTGYVGLVSGTCLAHTGHTVTCVDIDTAKVDAINHAKAPIYEEGLDELLEKNVGCRLQATTDLEAAVLDSDLTMIAVGTPFNGDEIDLTFIRQAAQQIGEALAKKDSWHMVVVKSTVVPGTTEDVVLPLVEQGSGKKAGADFGVGMNPEFLREGNAIEDFMNPDRIVLGGIDQRSLEALQALYAGFPNVDILQTSPRTAEMIKYTANALLATMISFSNEIGNLCAATGNVDVAEVVKGVHLDKRLSPILEDGNRITPAFTTYIEAGCGFGGSCFPKDVKALSAYGSKLNQPMPLLDAVITTNNAQPMKMMEMLRAHHADLAGKTVSLLGLAFKPGSDDVRESPAIPILDALLAAGAKVKVYDPIVKSLPGRPFGTDQLRSSDSLAEAVADSDAVLLTTRWAEFEALPDLLSACSNPPLVVDGRRMLDKSDFARYAGIGLG